jgi:hypothetical protein
MELSLNKNSVKIFLTCVLLSVVLYLANYYNIEVHFYFAKLVLIAFSFFIIQLFLPLRFKIYSFLAASLASLFIFFGLGQGFILAILILFIFTICNIDIPQAYKYTLLGITLLILALLKIGYISLALIPSDLITVIAGIFMFRAMIFMYVISNEKNDEPLINKLAYFL